MAGEGVFGTMLGRFGSGYTDERDRQMKMARQALLDRMAQQKDEAAQRQIESNNKRQDFQDALSASKAGYVPTGALQATADKMGGIAQTAPATMSQSVGPGADIVSAMAPTVANLAKEKQSSALQSAANSIKNGRTGKSYAFDYDSSPQGLQERRQQALDSQRLAADFRNKQQLAQEGRAVKGAEYADRLSRITFVNKGMKPERAQAIANDPKLYDAWATQAFGLGPPKNIDPYSEAGIAAQIRIANAKPQTGGRGSAQIKKIVAENDSILGMIDSADREVRARPQSVGLKFGMGDFIPFAGSVADSYNQRNDPNGVAARAAVANISSLTIKDRSGAAVTISEFPRLTPFIPRVSDTPDAIYTKLRKLKEQIQVHNAALLQDDGGADDGNAPSTRRPPGFKE